MTISTDESDAFEAWYAKSQEAARLLEARVLGLAEELQAHIRHLDRGIVTPFEFAVGVRAATEVLPVYIDAYVDGLGS